MPPTESPQPEFGPTPRAAFNWRRLLLVVLLVLLLGIIVWYVWRSDDARQAQPNAVHFEEELIDAALDQVEDLEDKPFPGPDAEYRGTGPLDGAEIERLKSFNGKRRFILDYSAYSESDLAQLKGLRNVHTLNLNDFCVNDAKMQCLNGFADLRVLSIWTKFCNPTDAGFEHLKGLTSLEVLDLQRPDFGDASMEHLKGMAALRKLYLRGSGVGDTGLKHLAGLPRLRELWLSGTAVTDAGLEHLKNMRRLQSLSLNGSRITDSGLEHLKRLRRLQRLDLGGTKVTDAGLEHLKGLTALRELDLLNTKVTYAGIARLRQALPNCNIHPWPPPLLIE